MATKLITFDCYGTLITWREGIAQTLGEILLGKGSAVAPETFVTAFHQIRHEETAKPYRAYKDILRSTLARTLDDFGLPKDAADGDRLLAGVRAIGPFREVPAVLETLRRNFRIAIVSNSDHDLMADNVANIGVPFDHVFVAEDARAYKPSLDFFGLVLDRAGVAPDEVLHVGASCNLDIEPASALGMRAVWINRRSETPPPACRPLAVLADLGGLPAVAATLIPR